MKTLYVASSIALCALLGAPGAFAADPLPPTPPEAGVPPSPSPDAGAPSLSQEADRHFDLALQAFSRAEYERAAEEIRKGANAVELASFRAYGYDRMALRSAAADVRELATFVEGGTVTDWQALESMFAKADHALALAHRDEAARSSTGTGTTPVGETLRAAERKLESAAAWTGSEVEAGAAWTRRELARAYGSLRHEIHAADEKPGGSAPASPFDVGA